jgi:hypothetical protein
MTESVWNVSFNVMSNCNCFQTAIESRVGGEYVAVGESFPVLVLPSDESVVVMAAHWQRELSVAGTLDDVESVWNESFNVISNCSCFHRQLSGVAGEDVFGCESFAVHVLPSDKGVVVMATHWQRELSVAGTLDNGVSLERV